MEELYKKYAGKACIHDNSTGIVCGYTNSNDHLIMAVLDGNKGLALRDELKYTIVNNKDNKLGYWIIKLYNIIDLK